MTLPVIIELDARNVKAPPRFEVGAPNDAANVVIGLLNDMGFGQSSAFWGPIHMPMIDMLGAQGLRNNDFIRLRSVRRQGTHSSLAEIAEDAGALAVD